MKPLCLNIIEDSPQRFECSLSDESGDEIQRWSICAPNPWLMAMHRVAILDIAIPNFTCQLQIGQSENIPEKYLVARQN